MLIEPFCDDARTSRIPGRETPVSRKNFIGVDELILLYLQFQFIF